VVFLGQAFFMILQRRHNQLCFRRWLLVTGLAAAPFLAWLFVLARSGGFATAYISWIPRPTLLDLPLTYYVLSVGATAGWQNPLTYLPLALYITLLAMLIWQRRTLAFPQRWALTATSWGVVLAPPLVWLASQRQPIYVDRYFLPLVPLLTVLIATSLSLLWRWRVRVAWGVLVVLLAVDAWSLVNLHFNPRYFRDDWRGAAAYIHAQATPDDALLTYTDKPLKYYSPGGLTLQDAWPMLKDPESTARATTGKKRLWLVLPLTTRNNHGFYEERDKAAINWIDRNPHVQWLMEHYSLLETRRLPGIQVMLFRIEQLDK